MTLVEMEAIEAVMRESGVDITPGDARRNLITRGIALNDLVGREFRVGEATLTVHAAPALTSRRLVSPLGSRLSSARS